MHIWSRRALMNTSKARMKGAQAAGIVIRPRLEREVVSPRAAIQPDSRSTGSLTASGITRMTGLCSSAASRFMRRASRSAVSSRAKDAFTAASTSSKAQPFWKWYPAVKTPKKLRTDSDSK